MTQIFVENYELDLSQELSNELTFSIDDIRNLDTKTTSFSKTILLQGTQNNNKIFGNIFELGNANEPQGEKLFYDFDASKSVNARIIVNGVQTMKGVLRLLSINIDNGIEYEVAIFGELGGFITAIGIKKLEELDFSVYNHEYSVGNIIDTFSISGNKISTGYIIGGSTIKIAGIHIFPKIGSTITVSSTSSNNGTFTIVSVSNTFGTFPLQGTVPLCTIVVVETLTIELSTTGTIEIDYTKDDGYGYIYPLIDYGVMPNPSLNFPTNWDYRNLRPALFVREYMDKIITGAGYTWESDFFNTNFFKKLIIPNNDAYLENKSATSYIEGSDSDAFTLITGTGSASANQDFNTLTLNQFTESGGVFTYIGTNPTQVKITVNFNYKGSVNFGVLRAAIIVRGGTSVDIKLDPIADYTPKTLSVVTNLVNGNQIEFVGLIQINPRAGNGSLYFDTKSTISVVKEPAGFVQYQLGDTLNINNTIPRNVYQRDFFVSIVKMFNLMVVEDRNKIQHLKIEPYIDFFETDRSTYFDWSYKVNRDKPITIKPMSEINARVYNFKFKDDTDYYNDLYKKQFNQQYGSRIFDNQLEFAKDNQNVELIFSPSVLLGFETNDKIFPAIYKYEESSGVKTPTAHNIRIMQINRLASDYEWDIYDNTSNLYTVPKIYAYAGHLDNPYNSTIDINWGATKKLFFNFTNGDLGNNNFNNFYSPYMAEIINKDSRLVTCEMKLTEKDIYNLDFSRFVMMDGVLFRLMKINSWSENNLCKVDLLRVINTSYQPDAPYSSKVFRMRFDATNAVSTWIGGDIASAEDWNTFFGAAVGKGFSDCFIEGYGTYWDVILTGNQPEIDIPTNAFKTLGHTLGVWDNIKAIKSIGEQAFASEPIKYFYSNGILDIGDATFIGSSLIEFVAPNCQSIGEEAFRTCTALRLLDLSNYPVAPIGHIYSEEKVFDNVADNKIILKSNKLAIDNWIANEGDYEKIISNNTVTIITI
mgnify:CR=1 FL=1